MICSKCGRTISESMRFCEYCGTPTSRSSISDDSNSKPQSLKQVQPSFQQANPPAPQQAAAGLAEDLTPSVLGLFATMFYMCIPILNIIMLVKVGFGKYTPPLKKAFVRAAAIFAVLMTAILIVAVGLAKAPLDSLDAMIYAAEESVFGELIDWIPVEI